MTLTVFGLDQSADNNKIKIDALNNTVRVDENTTVSVAPQNGSMPAMGLYAQAVRDGRAFTAVTPLVGINSGQFLNVVFANPAGSGINCFIVSRKLTANRAEGSRPIAYGFVPSPDPLTGHDTATGFNRWTGEAPSSIGLDYVVASQRLNKTPPIDTPGMGLLPNGGQTFNIDDDNPDATRVVPPGGSFGFFVGAYGYQQNADQCRMVVTWYEEPTS
ncbi:hypothetical protein VWZ82_12975 [Phaeobacter sp. JH20_41]|uniref:hypothetical protein n=1 Tax=Phaeobacter sp. JH20_41 TaxID=3112498 RepID=UPI003A84C884